MQDRLSGHVFAFYTNPVIALALLLGYAATASAYANALAPNIGLASNQGFCSPGAFQLTSGAPGQPPGLKLWGSFCEEGDRATGVAETTPFTAPPRFAIYIAGYLLRPGMTLEIENLANHSRLPIVPISESREQWVRYDIRLPPSWLGNPVRFIAKDDSSAWGGWFAFSEPLPSNGTLPGTREAITLLLRTLCGFVLLVLPALAAASIALRSGVRDPLCLGLLQLAAIGGSGYLAFALWFAAPALGHWGSLLAPIVSALCLAWIYPGLDAAARRVLTRSFVPLALVGAVSLLVVSAGFAYGGLDRPFEIPALRFSHPLPPDNKIPYIFAEGIRVGHVPKPLLGDWLSSDRPPLQTGLFLAQYPYVSKPRTLGYTLVSVIAQSLWIFGAWLFLAELNLNARAVVLVLAVCLFSGFVFLNSFYVWPKLIAAAFMLGLFALLFTPRYKTLAGSPFLCILAGALLAFSMLSHGGTAFAAIGTVSTMLVLRRFLPWKRIVLIAASAFVLYLPWICYQKFYDPPGNRLLKMHLADVVQVDSRSLPKAIHDAYGSITPRQYLVNRLTNFDRPFQNSERFWVEVADLLRYFNDPVNSRQIAAVMRGWFFFHIVPNLGFLMFAPLALLAGLRRQSRTPEWRAAAILWLFIGLTDVAWAFLMFRPEMTIIHAGTYVTILLGYAGAILALWAISRLLALILGALQIALNVLLYAVFMHAPLSPDKLVFESPLLLGCLVLAVLSLIGVVWLLWLLSRDALAISSAPPMRQELPVALRTGDGALHQLHGESGAT